MRQTVKAAVRILRIEEEGMDLHYNFVHFNNYLLLSSRLSSHWVRGECFKYIRLRVFLINDVKTVSRI